MPDAVDHPVHYNDHPSGVECIAVTEHFNFNRGNAIKYIWRAGSKGNELEDLRKAAWYVQREIDRLHREIDAEVRPTQVIAERDAKLSRVQINDLVRRGDWSVSRARRALEVKDVNAPRCGNCNRRFRGRDWKCCPQHTYQRGSDVVCEPCALLLHPDINDGPEYAAQTTEYL